MEIDRCQKGARKAQVYYKFSASLAQFFVIFGPGFGGKMRSRGQAEIRDQWPELSLLVPDAKLRLLCVIDSRDELTPQSVKSRWKTKTSPGW